MIVTYELENVYNEFMKRFRTIGVTEVLKEYDVLCMALQLPSVHESCFIDFLLDIQQIMLEYFVEVARNNVGGVEDA